MEAIIANCANNTIDAEVVVVISDKVNAEALQKARAQGIPTFHSSIEEKWVDCLQKKEVDLVCLAGFMSIIKEPLLQSFSGKIINIHPSLLPKFLGLNTHQRVLEEGETESGCTVHYVDEGIDTGEIIMQSRVPVYEGDTEKILAKRVLKEEHRIYSEAIQKISK
jgi:phosphoribosylglycinamide formyltransferase-1